MNERLRSKVGNERCKGFFGRSFGKYKGEAVERSSSPRVVRARELLLDRSNGMADIDTKVESICEEVIRRNPGELEFHQAVREVAGSLGLELRRDEGYGANGAGPESPIRCLGPTLHL